MKHSTLVLLSAVGLLAQSDVATNVPRTKNRFGLTVFNANQQNGSAGYHDVLPYFGGSLQWDDSYTASDARITNFRFEYKRTLASNFALGISFAKQLEKGFSMEVNQQVGGPTARLDRLSTTYSYSASGFGLALYYQKAVTFGLGFDQKSESASFPTTSNIVNGTGTTLTGQRDDFSRLWWRVTLGKQFDFEHVSPYIGVEFAKPLSSTNADNNVTSTELVKALAPTSQLGFVVGFYF